jgi:hypothetical protein
VPGVEEPVGGKWGGRSDGCAPGSDTASNAAGAGRVDGAAGLAHVLTQFSLLELGTSGIRPLHARWGGNGPCCDGFSCWLF